MASLDFIFKDPTLQRAEEIAINRKQPDRDYLGASCIGEDCARQVWYQYNRPSQPNKYAYAVEDGHMSELIMAERLRAVEGIELWTLDPETGQQFGFRDGKFRGHFDGVIRGLLQAPKKAHIWEHKCTKTYKQFVKALKDHGNKQALEKWNWNYYVQAQMYMHYTALDRHYLTVASPGTREVYSCRTEYNPEIAAKYKDRAKRIIDQPTEPPRAYKSETFFKCRWCSFSEECWRNENP